VVGVWFGLGGVGALGSLACENAEPHLLGVAQAESSGVVVVLLFLFCEGSFFFRLNAGPRSCGSAYCGPYPCELDGSCGRR
jgi:hypothetical protein